MQEATRQKQLILLPHPENEVRRKPVYIFGRRRDFAVITADVIYTFRLYASRDDLINNQLAPSTMRVNDNLINNQLAPSTMPVTGSTARAVSPQPLGDRPVSPHTSRSTALHARGMRADRTLIEGGVTNPIAFCPCRVRRMLCAAARNRHL